MNHLAHTLLSGPDADVVLGGMLGDFWHGALDPGWPAGVRAGVALHRKIDVYTDSHPVVAAARAAFPPPWRRYAGIITDVYFDHRLVHEWDRYAREPLAEFSRRFIALLERNRDWLPADLNRFAMYFRAHDLFAAYAQRETIEQVLLGIGRRLKRANPLGATGPVLWPRAGQLDEAFARFFPQLEAFAREVRERLGVP